jgi:hypothetical protein
MQNPAAVHNLREVLNKSTVVIKLRYPKDKQFSLQGRSGQSQTLTVERFEIVGVLGVGYGSTGTFVTENPPITLITPEQTPTFINKWWGDTIPVSDAWRFAVTQVILSTPSQP